MCVPVREPAGTNSCKERGALVKLVVARRSRARRRLASDSDVGRQPCEAHRSHGAAVIPHIVMLCTTPFVERFGGRRKAPGGVVLHGETRADAAKCAPEQIAEQRKIVGCPSPMTTPHVIAGRGTSARKCFEDADLDVLVVPLVAAGWMRRAMRRRGDSSRRSRSRRGRMRA